MMYVWLWVQQLVMLQLSRKPQVIRLHELQQNQRNRYTSEFSNTLQQFLPQSLWPVLPFLADIYYTYTTICLCRRRLGEEYTYVAMYNAKHYEEEGVLVNRRTRTFMAVLELVQRYAVRGLLGRLWARVEGMGERGLWGVLRDGLVNGVEGVLAEGKLFMMMLFILGWNKHFNLIDTILKNEYIYTYFNKSTAQVDYRIQGYMLLTVFIVKTAKFLYKASKSLSQKKKPSPRPQKIQQNNQGNDKDKEESEKSDGELCRICYDNIRNKSVTCCGHIFCWSCILRYLVTNPECPVCRAACEPKEIIQLQNY